MKKILLFVFMLITVSAWAQIPKPLRNTYVNDFAKVLTPDQITQLNHRLFAIEKDNKVQVAIVLVNKVPAVYDIEDFAVLIGKKWHVGKNKRGIVYVAAIKQRQQRLEVAKNLDSVFTGAKCLETLNEIKPSFKAGNYYEGLQTLVTKISDELPVLNTQGTVTQSAQVTPAAKVQNKDDKSDTFYSMVGLATICLPIIILIIYQRNKRRRQRDMMLMSMNNSQFYNPNNQGYNPYNQGYNPSNQGPGIYNSGVYGQPQQQRTNWGGILGGAAVGVAAGYAARTIQDNLSHDNNNNMPVTDTGSSYSNDTSDEDKPSNWGNWGDGSSGDSSSYDSGFSDSSDNDSSSDSGATSDW